MVLYHWYITQIFVVWFIDIYLFSVVYIIFILHLYLHSHSIRIYLFFHKHCILADSEKFYGPKCVKNWQDIKLSDDKLFPYRVLLGMGYVVGLVWVRSGFRSDLGFAPIWTKPDIWSNQWNAAIAVPIISHLSFV